MWVKATSLAGRHVGSELSEGWHVSPLLSTLNDNFQVYEIKLLLLLTIYIAWQLALTLHIVYYTQNYIPLNNASLFIFVLL